MDVTVYELVNDRLREIFVGTTRREPPALAGWSPGELRNVHVVETFDDEAEAQRFAERYSQWAPPKGWRLLR